MHAISRRYAGCQVTRDKQHALEPYWLAEVGVGEPTVLAEIGMAAADIGAAGLRDMIAGKTGRVLAQHDKRVALVKTHMKTIRDHAERMVADFGTQLHTGRGRSDNR